MFFDFKSLLQPFKFENSIFDVTNRAVNMVFFSEKVGNITPIELEPFLHDQAYSTNCWHCFWCTACKTIFRVLYSISIRKLHTLKRWKLFFPTPAIFSWFCHSLQFIPCSVLLCYILSKGSKHFRVIRMSQWPKDCTFLGIYFKPFLF